jgi:simple sugar transport system permease protein
MNRKEGVKFNYTFLLLGLLVLVLAAFTITKSASFWKLSTWQAMTMQFPEYGVMTLGVMLCFIAGCIDVSFVALGDLASIVGCTFMVRMTADGANEGSTGLIIIVGILIAFVVGAVGGLINGSLISRLGIPPILATLATQMVFRGLAIALTRGDAVTGIPAAYSEVGHINLFGFLPMPLFIFIIVLFICGFLLKFTTYGRKLYMIGSNQKAARFSAINTTRMINATFIINGVIATIGALLMVSTMNSAKADYGSSYLMRCILILVLAGVLPDGGMGRIFNVLISIITIQIIASGVNMFPELNAYYSSLISSVMLLIMLMATSRLFGERRIRKVTDKKELPGESG